MWDRLGANFQQLARKQYDLRTVCVPTGDQHCDPGQGHQWRRLLPQRLEWRSDASEPWRHWRVPFQFRMMLTSMSTLDQDGNHLQMHCFRMVAGLHSSIAHMPHASAVGAAILWSYNIRQSMSCTLMLEELTACSLKAAFVLLCMSSGLAHTAILYAVMGTANGIPP